MKRAIFSMVLLAASAFVTQAEAASSVYVACPLKEARTEITSSVPSGWWVTPQIGTLQDVRVQNVGGQPTLVCAYWAYGTQASVMRLFPEGMSSCAPKGAGFSCSSTSAAVKQPYAAKPQSKSSNHSSSKSYSSKKKNSVEEKKKKLSKKYKKLFAR
jgi:hypothetical protein